MQTPHRVVGSERAQTGKLRVDFVDPLFAVAIHIGFSDGLLQEEWFHRWNWPSGDATFQLLSFVLGFVTLILSWEGYHKSIEVRAIRSFWRFILDILIVVAYLIALVQFRNFSAVLSLLAAAYLLFILWDLFKRAEYQLPLSWRDWVTVGAFVALLLLAIVQGLVGGVVAVRWALLVLAFLVTAAYRVYKAALRWDGPIKTFRNVARDAFRYAPLV